MATIFFLLALTAGTANALRFGKSHDQQKNGKVAPEANQAVVVPVKRLPADQSCEFYRLVQLAKTAGKGRDVWVLYDQLANPDITPTDIEKNKLSNKDKRIIHGLQKEGIKFDAQPKVPAGYAKFGGTTSGFTKPSFVLWAVSKPEYDYFWHLEDDVFYTGKWGDLFDAAAQAKSSSDIIGSYEDKQTDPNWPHLKNCAIDGKPCLEMSGQHLQLRWAVSRFSKKFVAEIRAALSTGKTTGHHEALAPNFCLASSWCSMTQLPQLGVYHGFGWGDYKEAQKMSLQYLVDLEKTEVQPSRVYHPVKCEADESLGNLALTYA